MSFLNFENPITQPSTLKSLGKEKANRLNSHLQISDPEWYEGSEGSVVGMGEGEPKDLMINAEEALEKIISQLDAVIENAEKDVLSEETAAPSQEVDILPGFPEKIEGEM